MKRAGSVSTIVFFYSLIVILFLLGTLVGNHAITVISEVLPVPRQHHIIIDAGHGGEDGGAVSCTGQNESQINLQISLRLNDLMRLLGYDTIMIRETDTSVYTKGDTIAQKKVSDLKHRVNTVENTPDSILISIHQNFFPEAQYSGAQVFFSDNTSSEALANQIQADLVNTINKGSKRIAKQGSGIFLLDKIHTTGVLVECGFLSNATEEQKLRTPGYQKNLCTVIASSIARYLMNT